MIVGLALSVSNCASLSACAGRKPLLVSEGDTLTDELAKDILAYNETSAKLKCPGFNPKGKGFF